MQLKHFSVSISIRSEYVPERILASTECNSIMIFLVVCSTGEYLCDDGTCRMGSRCNGINDCDDGSDESSCSSNVLKMSQGYVNNALTRPDTSAEGEGGAMSYGKHKVR